MAMARPLACAPELDPVEAIRAYLKKHEIAHLGPHTMGERGQFARNRIEPMQRDPRRSPISENGLILRSDVTDLYEAQ